MSRNSPINLVSIFPLLLFFSAPILIFLVPFSIIHVFLFVFVFVWFGLSSSLFIHRVVTHKAAKLVPLLEIVFLIGSSISLSGSPIVWVSIHRCHHIHSDTDLDPHSPIHGKMWAYYGWVLHQNLNLIENIKKEYAKDLLKSRLYLFFDNPIMWVLPTIIFNITLYYFLGLSGVIWGFLLPGFLSYNFHWMLIASLCHLPSLGYRKFETNDNSRNLPWLSLLSFGESLHNNHHQNPRSAKLNTSIFEFDISFWFLLLFKKIGWASEVEVASEFSSK